MRGILLIIHKELSAYFKSMLGYLISDSTSVTTASYAVHHCVEIAGVASMVEDDATIQHERAVKF